MPTTLTMVDAAVADDDEGKVEVVLVVSVVGSRSLAASSMPSSLLETVDPSDWYAGGGRNSFGSGGIGRAPVDTFG